MHSDRPVARKGFFLLGCRAYVYAFPSSFVWYHVSGFTFILNFEPDSEPDPQTEDTGEASEELQRLVTVEVDLLSKP